MDIGSALSRKAGLTDRELAELPDYRTSDAFSELDRRVIELAELLTATPAEVPEALYAEIRAAIGDDALVELAAEIAWENYRARFNRAFEVGSQGFSEGGFCVLPARAGAQKSSSSPP
jgi:alkylhydroperoxidase family enzyme